MDIKKIRSLIEFGKFQAARDAVMAMETGIDWQGQSHIVCDAQERDTMLVKLANEINFARLDPEGSQHHVAGALMLLEIIGGDRAKLAEYRDRLARAAMIAEAELTANFDEDILGGEDK